MNTNSSKCLHNAHASIIEYSDQSYLLIQGRIHKSRKNSHHKKSPTPIKHKSKSKLANQKCTHNNREKLNKRIQQVKQSYLKNSTTLSQEKPRGGFHYSFRQMPNNNYSSKCNYNKQLEEQNIALRRQNKFLQDYVKVLEEKCLGDKNIKKKTFENSYEHMINSVLYDQNKTQNSGSIFGYNLNSMMSNMGRGYAQKDYLQQTQPPV